MSSDIKPIFAWEFISILGNSANMDLIRQAKGVPLAPTPTIETTNTYQHGFDMHMPTFNHKLQLASCGHTSASLKPSLWSFVQGL